MSDPELILRRQAQWQKSRQSLTWPEKIRLAERVRESVRQLRAQPQQRNCFSCQNGEMNPKFDRITVNPNQMNGQPCIRGMRLTVRRVLEAMATYPDHGELLAEYPDLQEADLQQALAFAAAYLDDRVEVA